jgi:hypothetical protein
MSKIFKIKIPKLYAGSRIPYDLIYLITRDQREIVHKLWDYALVMPFEASFQEVVYRIQPKYISEIGAVRNDTLYRQSLFVREHGTLKREISVKVREWWEEQNQKFDLSNRLVVVPLLLRRDIEKMLPRYLGSRKWMHKQLVPYINPSRRGIKPNNPEQIEPKLTTEQVAALTSPLSDLAYLATPFAVPNDKIRPICSICPRNFQHLQGKCVPGMAVCYTHLDLTQIMPKKSLPITEEIPF